MFYIIDFYKKFLTTSGRANITQYWIPCFFSVFVLMFLFIFITSIPPGRYTGMAAKVLGITIIIFNIFLFLYIPLTVIAVLTCSIRRMHDLDKSGWWILVSWVPFIGQILFFILTIMPGSEGNNQHGPQPEPDR
ncbi:MAG: DUF805 domain-containing protein [Elusimicrobiota bacterium]|nr:DUF805 domain-containing protein [Elusimicrobiota bacterium]